MYACPGRDPMISECEVRGLIERRSGATVSRFQVTFFLPLSCEHWAMSLVKDGLEQASREGTIVSHTVCISDQIALASSAMEDPSSGVCCRRQFLCVCVCCVWGVHASRPSRSAVAQLLGNTLNSHSLGA